MAVKLTLMCEQTRVRHSKLSRDYIEIDRASRAQNSPQSTSCPGKFKYASVGKREREGESFSNVCAAGK